MNPARVRCREQRTGQRRNKNEEAAVEVEIATLSQQGGRAYNEDVFGLWHDRRFVACVVADGAGGHGGGDVAAATARSSVLGAFAAAPGLDAGRLRELLAQANRAVVARQAEGGRLAAMRSTVVLAAIDLRDRLFAWAHSGDSRAYMFRGGALAARTVDHSLVQQLVSGGMIDEGRARVHPLRNLLLSALGAADDALEISVSAHMPLAAGDVLLLCSDGVWEVLGDEWLGGALQASSTPAQWVARIDQEIKSRAKPGHDNYTAVVLWLHADVDAA